MVYLATILLVEPGDADQRFVLIAASIRRASAGRSAAPDPQRMRSRCPWRRTPREAGRDDLLTSHVVWNTVVWMDSARIIGASDFKARCLALLDEVHDGGQELVITKRGEPIARLVPIARAPHSLRGAWKGHARLNADIVQVDWTADFEAVR
jgi:prevent-host-death family protein